MVERERPREGERDRERERERERYIYIYIYKIYIYIYLYISIYIYKKKKSWHEYIPGLAVDKIFGFPIVKNSFSRAPPHPQGTLYFGCNELGQPIYGNYKIRSFQNHLIVMGNPAKEGHPPTTTQGDGRLKCLYNGKFLKACLESESSHHPLLSPGNSAFKKSL